MKNILFLFAVLLISCADQKPKENLEITKEETQIAKDLIQGAFDDLWGGVDSTKILDYHTEDFIILENGEVWDNARIVEYMKSQLANTSRAKRVNIMDYISYRKIWTIYTNRL